MRVVTAEGQCMWDKSNMSSTATVWLIVILARNMVGWWVGPPLWSRLKQFKYWVNEHEILTDILGPHKMHPSLFIS